jgi:hypothetical protein
MSTTQFLSALWGPVMLAIGVGMFTNRDYYARIYRGLEGETFATFIFGGFAMAAGIAQILAHNKFGDVTKVIVTLLGWGLFIKGLTFVVAPHLAERGGNWAANVKLVPALGVVLIVVGAYLSYVAYLA